MQDYEKLGLFYLGKTYDMKQRKVTPDLLLYESKDLTTHAVCVGMTGSGKTGLGIALLEEAAIDGIPVIAIDPKGDLGNLLLGFPELRPEDFLPWVDPDEAGRRGLAVEQFAAQTAEQWSEGLAAWGEDGAAHRAAPRRGRSRDLYAGKQRRAAADGAPLVRRPAAGSARPDRSLPRAGYFGRLRSAGASGRRRPTRSPAANTSCFRMSWITPGVRGTTSTWRA